MTDKRVIKVFLTSPGDLTVERRAFKDQIDLLNLGFGDGAGVEFKALGWEDTLSSVGRRAQAVINAEIDECDVFVLAMNRRWGQPAPDSPYSSYTEEEFHRGLDRWNRTKAPEIFVFFKHVDGASIADPGPQLEKVLKFRLELEQSRMVLYRNFADEHAFKAEVDKHLRAYTRGELPKANAEPEKIVLPLEYVQRVEEAQAEAKQQAERAEKAQQRAEAQAARVEELALTAARQASQAALDGHVEEASQAFATATDGASNLMILYLAYDFYDRTGDFAQAEEMLERWLAISGRDSETTDTATAYGNLGLIYRTRGDLGRAEEMHRKALAIDEKLGHLEGVGRHYGNLGLIYQTRGDPDRAEEMHRKALEINEKLGHLEGMAAKYGNLGVIYQTRGDLDHAEEILRKALEIEEKLGRLEGMANWYNDLGMVYRRRGDPDRAEEMLRKALEINEKLGRLEGMANDYCGLGLVSRTRGDLDRSEEMHRKALEINEKLGRLEGMAANYGNLGVIYQTRGDLDRSEEMHCKALEIDEKLGRVEGIANAYSDLGTVYEKRGDRAVACDYWTKARDLYAQIGMPHMVEKMQGLLDETADGGENAPQRG